MTLGVVPRDDAPCIGAQRKQQSRARGWSELPVQDRFGGLAGHSRGGPMGVRLTRVVNGDGSKPRFQCRQRGINTRAPPVELCGATLGRLGRGDPDGIEVPPIAAEPGSLTRAAGETGSG